MGRERTTANPHLEPRERISGKTKNGAHKRVHTNLGRDVVMCEETKGQGFNETEKKKMQHKALWFYIQAQVHTHAGDHREVEQRLS